MNVQHAVLDRYSEAAKEREASLCCPVTYEPELLRALPHEIIEKDYGCGDPSRYVRSGDTVLDLGCGGGKICYIVAQLVGPSGRVIGIDMNDEMLALARKYQPEMAARLGNDRVRFLKGYIQDLAFDLGATETFLNGHPVSGTSDLHVLEQEIERQRQHSPLIPDASVDVVISNCVLNLVRDKDKQKLISEIRRVLKPGGRVAISDIVSDEPVPQSMKADARLWSGCISGAFTESGFLTAFLDAGFLAVAYDKWDQEPWKIIDGIEFRSVTLTATKGEEKPCIDVGHAVIYKGPFASVTDDEGHIFPRGERMAVCERTYRFLTDGPYKDDFIGIIPHSPREASPWCAPSGTRRPVRETKGAVHETKSCDAANCC